LDAFEELGTAHCTTWDTACRATWGTYCRRLYSGLSPGVGGSSRCAQRDWHVACEANALPLETGGVDFLKGHINVASSIRHGALQLLIEFN